MKNSRKIKGYLVAWVAVAFLGIAVPLFAQTTNLVPYIQSFEDYFDLDGSNIVSSLGWEGEEGAVVALVTSYSAPSYPLITNHTTVAELREPVTIHVDGSEQANSTLWVDYLVKPKRWEEDNPPEDIPEDAQLAVFVDTNGFLNVFHTAIDAEFATTNLVWSVIDDPAFHIADNEWVRISVNMDYEAADGLAAYFQLLLNGETVRHANAHYHPQAGDYWAQDLGEWGSDDGMLGSWFAMRNAAATQLNAINLRGSGLFDDFVVSAEAPVISNIFYHTINVGVIGNGSIAATDNDINSDGDVKVLPDASQAFTWEADYGHVFDNVIIGENGATNTFPTGYETGYTFTNMAASGSVVVNFAAMQTFNLVASASGGTITPSGTFSVVSNENRTFTWSPSYGYVFDSVTIVENGDTNTFTDVAYQSGYTFTNVSADCSVAVMFEALPTFNIEASATDGSISPSGTVAVPVGYDRAFSWSPSYGYTFESVTIGENGVTNTYTDVDYQSGYTFTNVVAEGSIAVTFTALPRYTIEASAVFGTIDPSGLVTDIVEGESRVFSWQPEPGYRFLNVIIGENEATNTFTDVEYQYGYTFANVVADGSIAVTFEEIPRSPGLKQWLIDTGLGLGFEMTPDAWKAYIASTDPTNPAFLFEVSRAWKTNGTNFVQWRSIYVDTNLPPFGILATTNLMQPMSVTGLYPRVASGSNVWTNTWSEAAAAWPVYYRVVATNNPPEEEEP